jgi:hypothetical protein
LESQAAYRDRQYKRLTDAMRQAAQEIEGIQPGATLEDVIRAIKRAAGIVLGTFKQD